MWIERSKKKQKLINDIIKLNNQVLIVQGARQVGKTSFILDAFQDLKKHPQLMINLLYASSFRLGGVDFLGRDFFGKAPGGEEFLKNIEAELGPLKSLTKPALIFVDEVDRYPMVMEAIQTLASFSKSLKFVFTGSNLENISVSNVATGRRKYFDLYPVTFLEFLKASQKPKLIQFLEEVSLNNLTYSEYYHRQLKQLQEIYLRLGGMPKILDAYLDPKEKNEPIPEIVKDLAFSIEENVKAILGEKSKLYEYQDVLRKLALLSMNTLKYTHLQVQHAGRQEAQRLVTKTVGARVAHKIRLFDSEKDLSKYILFDCGIVNFLLGGSDLLKTQLGEKSLAILYETFVGQELISQLITREDLFYWKSGNLAEIEFLIRSPKLMGIDVKTKGGKSKSLNSFAIFEKESQVLLKINSEVPSLDLAYQAKLPNYSKQRSIAMVSIPHYLTCRIFELTDEILN